MNSTLPARGAYVLRPHGKLDAAAAAALIAMVGGELNREEPRTIVLDMRAVTSLSQSGIAALMACRRRAERAGTQLQLQCEPGRALELLEDSGLDRVFDITD
jgi:phospholipid transport system transporter-binding protein